LHPVVAEQGHLAADAGRVPRQRASEGSLGRTAAGSGSARALRASPPSGAAGIGRHIVIGWFVRDALDAPSWRWLGLNQYNSGLTVIRYTGDGRRPLVTFNDVDHLPKSVRGTGMPPELLI
jgi:hypothetical protein